MSRNYIRPENICSPKNRVKNGSVQIIFEDSDKTFSISSLEWKSINTGEYEPRIGIRWNGNEDDNTLGYPLARGNPAWFIIPKEMALSYLQYIGKLTIEVNAKLERSK